MHDEDLICVEVVFCGLQIYSSCSCDLDFKYELLWQYNSGWFLVKAIGVGSNDVSVVAVCVFHICLRKKRMMWHLLVGQI